jgi:hypothetical protein
MPGRSRWVQRSRLCSVLLLVFILSECSLSTSGATEQLSIQTLIAQAPSYELRIVTLRGIIKDMRVMPPTPSNYKCSMLYGQATFILDDGTGSLPMDVLPSCLPQAAASLPKDGDQVVLNAVIHISYGELPVRVWAQATEIRLVPDATK